MTKHFKDVDGTDVNIRRDTRGRFAIHSAAFHNNLEEIKRLLSLGAIVNSTDKKMNTPLHEAARFNLVGSHFDTIEMLLKNGADINAQNDNKYTALHYLVSEQPNVETVNLLLNSGATVDIKDDLGETPLFKVVLKKFDDVKILKLLVDRGSNVNTFNNIKQTPLHVACKWNSLKVIKFLLENGANIEALDFNGLTPLMMMLKDIRYCSYRVAFFFKLANFNAPDFSGNKLLSIDVKKKFWKMILKHLAKIHALDLPVNSDIFESIAKIKKDDDIVAADFFKECKDELLIAKRTKLRDCWVTFFNLLVDSKRKLKNYAGNKILVQEFKKSNCLIKFPIYGSEMLKNMEKGIKRRESFDKSCVVLSDCLPVFSPNHLIIEGILNCLTLKDYVALISVFS